MTEDEEPEPEGQPNDERPPVDPVRRTLKGPGGDTEKALGLEIARLFGVSPKLLVSRPSRPEGQSPPQQSTPQDEDASEPGSAAVEDGRGTD